MPNYFAHVVNITDIPDANLFAAGVGKPFVTALEGTSGLEGSGVDFNTGLRAGSGGILIEGSYAAASDASLFVMGDAPFLAVRDNIDIAINSNLRFDMADASLEAVGAGPAQTLEVMSRDIGGVIDGLDRSLPGHYPIGTLRLLAGSNVLLVDVRDNDGLGQITCEAIYADVVLIEPGARLANAACRVYYNTLVNDGQVDVPGNLLPISPECAGDFNDDGSLDSQDFFDFLEAFFVGDADFNQDGGTDSQDYFDFLEAFFVGCE